MMRWIVGSSLRFRYLVVGLAVAMMVLGGLQLRTMPVDVFPEFAPPRVEIQTACVGLSAADVESLVTVPLEQALNDRGIAYLWLPSLGGRRRPDSASVNVGWRVPAFRAYADHVATEEFAAGLFELLMIARGLRTAVMCAEVLWWRCHRRLIADVLASLDVSVVHIRDERASEVHRLAAPARLVRGRLTYTAEHDTAR